MIARIAGLVVLAAVGLATGVLAASGATSRPVTRVTVSATEFEFTLSRQSVPIGTVVFTVVNRGKLAHDFRIAGHTTPLLKPGRSATLRVTFTRKGRYGYVCTVAGHAAAGMKGVLAVGTGPLTTPPSAPVTTTTTTITGPATTVDVGMYEYRFDLSQTTIPAGKVTFVVTNDGSLVHNFDVVGVKAGAYLSPGQSETWTVGLSPGTYDFKCDVPFHADRGMAGKITVS